MKKGWGLSLLHPPLPFPLPLFLTIGAERLGTADSDTAYLSRDNPAFEVEKDQTVLYVLSRACLPQRIRGSSGHARRGTEDVGGVL
jgi:hypothetical protein